MEVDTDDDLLRTLAAGGSIDNTHWPRVLNTLVSRIESNCYNNFAIPIIPPPKRTQSVLPDWNSTVPDDFNPISEDSVPGPSSSGPVAQEDIDKENTEPDVERASTEEVEDVSSSVAEAPGASKTAEDGTAAATSAAAAAATAASENTPDEAGSSSMPPPPVPAKDKDVADGAESASVPAVVEPPKMPEPAVELIEYITSHLTNTFPKYPPHSIQRLAELVVFPHQHYRYLGPYLSALERVVSVTSGSNRYPLPSELPPTQAAILNGTAARSSSSDNGQTGLSNGSDANGSDGGELKNVNSNGSNGSAPADPSSEWSSDTSWGALLTPIPWLRGQQPNNNSNTDDDRSTTEEAGGEGGSSPLDGSDDDGSEIAFSTTSSTAGAGPSLNTIGTNANDTGGLRDSQSLSPSRSPSPSPAQQQQKQQQQQATPSPSPSPSQSALQSQQQPQQRRLEVRTEATETIDGPNGVGSIETVSVSINGISSASSASSASSTSSITSHGAAAAAAVVHLQQRGITQGELLRQEQKAGVVPVSQLARAAAAARAARGPYSGRYLDNDDDDDEPEEDEDHEMDDGGQSRVPFAEEAGVDNANGAKDTAMGGTESEDKAGEDKATEAKAEAEAKPEVEAEIPHARGPQELGAADMGPQPNSSSTSAPGLQIGSAADDSAVHTVHMGEMNLESAVGRAADALPTGTVAAPLVPSAVVDSTEVVAKEDVVPPGSAPTSVLSPARATTPKREAEQSLGAALPAKKRKGDSSEDEKTAEPSRGVKGVKGGKSGSAAEGDKE